MSVPGGGAPGEQPNKSRVGGDHIMQKREAQMAVLKGYRRSFAFQRALLEEDNPLIGGAGGGPKGGAAADAAARRTQALAAKKAQAMASAGMNTIPEDGTATGPAAVAAGALGGPGATRDPKVGAARR